MTYRIVTVCTGNICRSPMAEYLIARALQEEGLDDAVEVTSGGTTSWEEGEPIDPRAGALLRARGIDPSSHRAKQVGPRQLQQADLVLALDHDHLGPLRRQGGKDVTGRTHLLREFDPDAGDDLGIRDPWYGDREDFESAAHMIDAAVPGIVDHVRSALDGTPQEGERAR